MSRILGLAGGDEAPAERLRPLRLFLMVHVGFECLSAVPWDGLVGAWGSLTLVFFQALTGLLISLAIGLCLVWYSIRPDARQRCSQIVTVLGVLSIAWHFPAVANHYFLAVFCLLIVSIVDPEDGEEALAGLQTLRLVVASMFFFTGLQKVLYGTYFRAEFLTWSIAGTDRFAALFGWLLPATELARIQSLPASGPFYSEWWPLILVSNSVWIFEVVMPFFLLHPKTRNTAAYLVAVFIACIELGAREWFFAFVFLPLLLLFPRRNWLPKTVPALLAVYAVVTLVWIADRWLGTTWLEVLGRS